MSGVALDLEDIQGNILAGFNTNAQEFVGLSVNPDADARRWLGWVSGLAAHVTTVSDIRAGRARMRTMVRPPLPWLALALSRAVLAAARPSVIFHDEAFRLGMARRARPVLGDRTRPADWRVGSPDSPVDVLLVIASNSVADAMQRTDEIVEEARQAGLTVTYRELGERLENDAEHFGFRDGLSQPRISGYDVPADLWPGQILFGHPAERGGNPVTRADDAIGLTHNGSYLVFRRLVQDVAAFHAFCSSESTRLRPVWPDLSAKWLAALIVGRWPSGALVSARVGEDPGHPSNEFDFSDDQHGLSCPFGAHIRKVNPRGGPRDVVDVPRVLRRGIPFVSATGDRGLLFAAYQSSIRDQFEFLSGSWMNDPNRPEDSAGHDVLVGRAPARRSFSIQGPGGPVVVEHSGPEWTMPTGGAYLFAPSRSGLRRLVDN